jgi:hypothetical protein
LNLDMARPFMTARESKHRSNSSKVLKRSPNFTRAASAATVCAPTFHQLLNATYIKAKPSFVFTEQQIKVEPSSGLLPSSSDGGLSQAFPFFLRSCVPHDLALSATGMSTSHASPLVHTWSEVLSSMSDTRSCKVQYCKLSTKI